MRKWKLLTTAIFMQQSQLEIELPVKPSTKARHVVVDSTGIKIYGEGEWKTRQHGVSKRRTWRKLHLAIDESTGEILEAEVTTNDYGDCEILEGLLDFIRNKKRHQFSPIFHKILCVFTSVFMPQTYNR